VAAICAASTLLLVRGAGGGAPLVQGQHLLDQGDHARVAGCHKIG